MLHQSLLRVHNKMYQELLPVVYSHKAVKDTLGELLI